MSNSKVKLNWQTFPIELFLVVAYLLMGFLGKLWHPGWVVFLVSPLYHWVVAVITNKRIKGVPTVLSVLVSVLGFLLLGFIGNLWHPGWLIFFLIPITASLEYFFSGGLRGKVNDVRERVRSHVGIHDDQIHGNDDDVL